MKNSGHTYEWVSAYLFYNGDLDYFLSKIVLPFIRFSRAELNIDDYFFIRYWEDGPHIRLRLKCKRSQVAKLKAEIEKHFIEFFKPAKHNPGNTVKFIEYIPEVERYGGSNGITIAEDHFQTSSETALTLINQPSWNYGKAIGSAITLHLLFMHPFAESREAKIEFYQRLCSGLINYLLPANEAGAVASHRSTDIIKTQLHERFSHQRSILINHCRAVLEGISSRYLNDSLFDAWLERSFITCEKFRTLYRAQELLISQKSGNAAADRESVYFVNDLFPILSSLIHMTNNRLGVINQDEPFVAYLLTESLKAID